MKHPLYKHQKILWQINGKNGSYSIRCWDSISRPLGHESPPITTNRPGLIPWRKITALISKRSDLLIQIFQPITYLKDSLPKIQHMTLFYFLGFVACSIKVFSLYHWSWLNCLVGPCQILTHALVCTTTFTAYGGLDCPLTSKQHWHPRDKY